MAKTAIQDLLAQYKKDPQLARTPTMREYMIRMHRLPRLAPQHGQAENGFAIVGDLSAANMRLISGMLSAKMLRSSFKEEMDNPVSLVREMQLICFEAKPRAISLALGGYTASDFFAYIYQDVARRRLSVGEDVSQKPFVEIVDEIKTWMRIMPRGTIVNNAQRHIRRRIMAMFNRSNHQAASLIEDREMPFEVISLIHKLLERDDDQGYTRGDLRDFNLVREDMNALAEHCISNRFEKGAKEIEDLSLVCCPSKVENFADHVIQRPRGRPRNDGKVAASGARKQKRKITKTTSPDGTGSANKKQIEPTDVVDDPLKALEQII